MLDPVTVQQTGAMPARNPLCLELEFTVDVGPNHLFIKPQQRRITGAAMGIVTGKTGGTWLIGGAVALDVLGVPGETFVAEDAGPAMTPVAEGIGCLALGQAVDHVVILLQQPPVIGTMGPLGGIGIVATVAVVAAYLGDLVGALLAGGVGRDQADYEGAAPFGLHRVKRGVGDLEFGLFAAAVGRQIGTVAVAFVAQLIFVLNVGDEISDPLPLQAAKRLVLFHHVRVMTIDTLGVAGSIDDFLGQGLAIAMNAGAGQNRVVIGLAQLIGDVGHLTETNILEIASLYHLIPGRTRSVTGQTDIFLPINGHSHSAMAGPTGLGHQREVAVRTTEHTTPGNGSRSARWHQQQADAQQGQPPTKKVSIINESGFQG